MCALRVALLGVPHCFASLLPRRAHSKCPSVRGFFPAEPGAENRKPRKVGDSGRSKLVPAPGDNLTSFLHGDHIVNFPGSAPWGAAPGCSIGDTERLSLASPGALPGDPIVCAPRTAHRPPPRPLPTRQVALAPVGGGELGTV